MGVTGVVAVADHAGDGEPPVAHPVLPLQGCLAGEAGGDAQHAATCEDRFLGVVIVYVGRDGEDR